MRLKGNVPVLPDAPYLAYLHTKIRGKHADLSTFTHFSDQFIRQLLVKASELLDYSEQHVTTPIGDVYQGKVFSKGLCGVSVIRAGESMDRFMTTYPSVQLITASIEESMNDEAFMRPDIGDFGDRYFATYPVESYE
ncbi:uracil phosphoribosyltransferase [Photobacterium angustum]|uniref:Phosphoribosyltransferase domain-containing protein n=1 Tax=Photobacterium angustum (strain S14 / CCUG 15956) TaxID=314292 RepID=Q1ZU96_PHOAS|nr:uracil phosphoribosyltransferase [Photobacterium angustum]EAS66514.1 hypothetical protein VAS14_14394 [Photobacterium angustum S14]